ncbi:MAG: hypothetical protein ABL308_12795 [Oceanicaulis sp.]
MTDEPDKRPLSAQADPRRNPPQGAPANGVRGIERAAREGAAKAGGKPKALSAIELLETHRRGDILDELDAAIAEVVEKVAEYAGKGSVTLKLDFALGNGGVIELRPKVERKRPAKPIGIGVLFHQGEGRIARNDLRQTDLEEFTD